MRAYKTSWRPKNSCSVCGAFSPGRSTVSRKTLPLPLMLETRMASSSAVSEGSLKKMSMNSELSRSLSFLMREKALMRSAWRYRGNGHRPNRSSALSSIPTIRMSGEIRGLLAVTDTPCWTRVDEIVFLNRKFKSSIFCSRLRTRTVPELSANRMTKTRRPMTRPKYFVSRNLDAAFFSATRAPSFVETDLIVSPLGAALLRFPHDLQLHQPVLRQLRPDALAVEAVHGLVPLLGCFPRSLGFVHTRRVEGCTRCDR